MNPGIAYAALASYGPHTSLKYIQRAWGPAQETQIDYLRVAIRGLRRKLERDAAAPELILNEPAVGYRLSV